MHCTYSYLQGKIHKEYETKDLLAVQRNLKRKLDKQSYNYQILFYVCGFMFIFILYGIVRYFKNKKEARIKYEELLLKIENSEKHKESKPDEHEFSMSKDAEDTVLYSLKKFENSKKFLEKNLTLTKLAVYFNTNTKYLSVIIARHRNKKFNEYINCLKVDSIAKRIR